MLMFKKLALSCLSVLAMVAYVSASAAEIPKDAAKTPDINQVEPAKIPTPRTMTLEPGEPLTSATCLKCHETVKTGKVKPGHFNIECLSCHTVKPGGGLCAKGSVKFPEQKQCLSCHKKDKKLINWSFAEHSKSGGQCVDCHEMHTSPLIKKTLPGAEKIQKDSVACVKCHQDVTSRLNMSSHHPVKEGGLSCISCHNPHDSNKTVLKSKSEQCLSCHQAVRGPMAFEHAPVVEDCMTCHTPHGSPNRKLLSVSQPAVCLQCHSIAQGKHGYGGSGTEPALNVSDPLNRRIISGAVLRSCTNCHGAIHGSHQDPLLRY